MLVTMARPGKLADIYRLDGQKPETALGIDVGITTTPLGAAVTAWECPVVETSRLSLAQLRINKKADSGTNSSVYVSEGVYETNYTVDKVPTGENPRNYFVEWKEKNQPRVYLVMPADIAEINRKAEQEHVDDFLLAYELTLKKYESCLSEVKAPTAANFFAAKTAFKEALKKLLPMALQPAADRPAQCLEKYQELCQKSFDRDTQCWHSFGIEPCAEPVGMSTYYLTGTPREEKGRVYFKLNIGQTEVGSHTCKSVIKML
jgi:hypothetical protein